MITHVFEEERAENASANMVTQDSQTLFPFISLFFEAK